MSFDLWAAVFAGMLAGIMMEMATVVPRVSELSVKLDLHVMWGRILGLRNPAAGVVGTAVHLGVSAGVGLVYAWGLEALFGADDSLWAWGLVGGLIHWFVAGVFMGVVLPAIHPDIPQKQVAPGFFVIALGKPDFAAFFIGHLLYGVTFGILYPYLSSGGGAAIAF